MVRKNYREIFKLAGMLAENGIPFEFHEINNGARIAYPDDDNVICSVIEHDGSYGHEDDTLEIMGLLSDLERKYDICCGNLMAKTVFDRINKHYSLSEL